MYIYDDDDDNLKLIHDYSSSSGRLALTATAGEGMGP